MQAHAHEKHHVIPYSLYIMIWAALIALTGVTVGVSYVDMKSVAILTALLIATVKATLVLLYFMHIRFERPLYSAMIIAVLVTYGVFVALTFSDYFYR